MHIHRGRQRETKGDRERDGYNLRIDSWIAFTKFDEDRAVVDDNLLWAGQLQDVAKEHFCDDVL